MIDVHCHLNDKAFDEDRDEVVKKAREKGITEDQIEDIIDARRK